MFVMRVFSFLFFVATHTCIFFFNSRILKKSRKCFIYFVESQNLGATTSCDHTLDNLFHSYKWGVCREEVGHYLAEYVG